MGEPCTPGALSSLADALAGLAAAEPERVAAIAFDRTGKGARLGFDVLDYAAGLAQFPRGRRIPAGSGVARAAGGATMGRFAGAAASRGAST